MSRTTVAIQLPRIREKRHYVEMAISNARLRRRERWLAKEKAERERIQQGLKALKEYLRLEGLPRTIEWFDNTNIQGSDPVASMVTCVESKPRKGAYKKLHIKPVVGADDYASMREVITRRYTHVIQNELQPPDLILVDGGRGQLNAALEALEAIGYDGRSEVAGLAERLEEVYLPGKQDPVMIPKTSPALKLLQQVRDEAHRFALEFHRQVRSKRTLSTELTSIPGIGEKRAAHLLTHFGSVANIKKADIETLQEFLGKKSGQMVHDYFNNHS